mgnify:CR=1 FL=1
MKKLINLWHYLTDEDFDVKLSHAKNTYKNIVTSTNTDVSHFYDRDGVQIRGFHNRSIRFEPNTNIHPLIIKYN